ncbi:acyl-CoA dehydrogenase [Siminovitchia acidinfaciens]|uniref:Acyl-CoA dehydrogenase n=1 Tax=Siminovitchia acidinfaciens TaxID=2321395 RepID=A0A429XZZ1_9BACI|nr:acyl-CoA dehydrogenase family protein [Siminovitchia acidinfaciens]RST74343.1 acyl-CoA dehydrogenase [Siminovitchia acidinfaciens]
MFGESVVNKIRGLAAEIDQSRGIPVELMNWMFKEKLFKLFAPEELGGSMLDLPAALRVIEKVSEIEGNLGWLTAIGSGGGMFVPYIQKGQTDILFNGEKAVLAGSGHPQGTAKRVDGGFIVTGEWKYCSGAEFATFFTANSMKEDGEVTSFIFMPDQVEVLHDWKAFGLRGTGSHTIKVEDAFVPEERTFNLMHKLNDYDGPVHTFPFVPFSQATFTSVCLGIAANFLREAKVIAARRLKEGADPFEKVLTDIQKNEEELQRELYHFYEEIEALWEDHLGGKLLTAEQEDHFSRTCKKPVEQAITRAGMLVRRLGMEAIMEDSAINKIWRDLYTAGQHTFITP